MPPTPQPSRPHWRNYAEVDAVHWRSLGFDENPTPTDDPSDPGNNATGETTTLLGKDVILPPTDTQAA